MCPSISLHDYPRHNFCERTVPTTHEMGNQLPGVILDDGADVHYHSENWKSWFDDANKNNIICKERCRLHRHMHALVTSAAYSAITPTLCWNGPHTWRERTSEVVISLNCWVDYNLSDQLTASVSCCNFYLICCTFKWTITFYHDQ